MAAALRRAFTRSTACTTKWPGPAPLHRFEARLRRLPGPTPAAGSRSLPPRPPGRRDFGSEERAAIARSYSESRSFSVRHILDSKKQNLNTVPAGATLQAAAEQMVREEVGSLMVTADVGDADGDGGDVLAGILTERDYLRATGGGVAGSDLLVGDIMTPRETLITVTADTSLAACAHLMAKHQFRHLPVMEGGKLVGMIGSRHLLSQFLQYHEVQVERLESFISYPVW